MIWAAVAILGFVTLQRIAELVAFAAQYEKAAGTGRL